DTGCGKSTQVAQYLVEAGFATKGCIGVTEPRRVAAMSLARRVAEEANVELGAEVGYKIRFDACVGDNTIVQYMTDGVLLRECINKPDLGKYSVIIVDEAHERSINIDVLLGLLKSIVRVRGDFKLVVMSATIDVEKFSNFFYKAPVLTIPGKSYSVEVFYTQNDDNFTPYHEPAENNLLESICNTVDYILEDRRDLLHGK
uniref:RNA helicase n=1 Tax=Steinernema glaseri TaxID=37863 RepID=A0A1I7Y448_9BILA